MNTVTTVDTVNTVTTVNTTVTTVTTLDTVKTVNSVSQGCNGPCSVRCSVKHVTLRFHYGVLANPKSV